MNKHKITDTNQKASFRTMQLNSSIKLVCQPMEHLKPFYIALYIVLPTLTDNFIHQTQKIC